MEPIKVVDMPKKNGVTSWDGIGEGVLERPRPKGFQPNIEARPAPDPKPATKELTSGFDFTTPEGREGFKKSSNFEMASDWVGIDLPPIEWIVDGLVDKTALVLIGAEETSGKSIVITQMAHQIAVGGEFLGRRCTPTPVIYCVVDEPEKNFKRRMQIRKLPSDAPLMHIAELSEEEFTTVGFLKSLNQKIDFMRALYGKSPVIFMDTLTDMLQIEDENNSAEVKRKLGLLRELIRRTECTVIVTIHYNKNTATNKRNRVSGSKAFRSKADIVFDLIFSIEADETSPRILGMSKGRNPDPWTAVVLDYNHATRNVTISETQLSAEEKKEHDKGLLVVQAIANSEDGNLSIKEITEQTGLSGGTLTRVLERLKQSGRIVQGKRRSGKGGAIPWELPAQVEEVEVNP